MALSVAGVSAARLRAFGLAAVFRLFDGGCDRLDCGQTRTGSSAVWLGMSEVWHWEARRSVPPVANLLHFWGIGQFGHRVGHQRYLST